MFLALVLVLSLVLAPCSCSGTPELKHAGIPILITNTMTFGRCVFTRVLFSIGVCAAGPMNDWWSCGARMMAMDANKFFSMGGFQEVMTEDNEYRAIPVSSFADMTECGLKLAAAFTKMDLTDFNACATDKLEKYCLVGSSKSGFSKDEYQLKADNEKTAER